jgi:hypothetical protein
MTAYFSHGVGVTTPTSREAMLLPPVTILTTTLADFEPNYLLVGRDQSLHNR